MSRLKWFKRLKKNVKGEKMKSDSKLRHRKIKIGLINYRI